MNKSQAYFTRKEYLKFWISQVDVLKKYCFVLYLKVTMDNIMKR